MSYGHPCKRITVWPSLGPASAYPTLRTPASIFLRGPSEVFAVVGAVTVVCATVFTVDPPPSVSSTVTFMPLAQRLEGRPDLFGEQLRLFPSRKVPAPVDL